MNADNLPEIGTSEAAVRSAVSLIAGMCGKPETVMAYWLDLYYFCRSAYEREQEIEAALWIRETAGLPQSLRDSSLREGAGEANLSTASGPPPLAGEAEEAPKPEKYRETVDEKEFKLATREKLLRMRENGLTVGKLATLSKRKLDHDKIMSVIEGKKVVIQTYRTLAEVLDEIEKAGMYVDKTDDDAGAGGAGGKAEGGGVHPAELFRGAGY